MNFRNDRSFNLGIIIKPAVFAGKQKISGLYVSLRPNRLSQNIVNVLVH